MTLKPTLASVMRSSRAIQAIANTSLPPALAEVYRRHLRSGGTMIVPSDLSSSALGTCFGATILRPKVSSGVLS